MKNKIIKVFLLFIVILLAFNMYPVFANDPVTDPGWWEPTIENNNSTKFETKVETLLGYINTIGIVISVIIIVIVGLKYMLGSVEEKAEYKKTMIGFLIGALLLFTATTIPNILYNIGTSLGEDQVTTTPTE